MSKQLLNEKDIEKTLSRISDEILSRNKDTQNICIIGVKQRGDILAKRIAGMIESKTNEKITLSAIDITFYRDDVRLKAYKYASKSGNHFDVTDKHVVLVDDVIFTGRSIRAAIDAIIDSGRPRTIQLAVMIDKGHRELPIQPDYLGKKVDVSPEKDVQLMLKETDGKNQVIINNHGK